MSTSTPQLLRVHLEYVHPWPNHLGMFVARAKGWYKEVGLDVSIIADGWDRGTPAQLIARGEYDMAPIRLGELLELRHSELPMVGSPPSTSVRWEESSP